LIGLKQVTQLGRQQRERLLRVRQDVIEREPVERAVNLVLLGSSASEPAIRDFAWQLSDDGAVHPIAPASEGVIANVQVHSTVVCDGDETVERTRVSNPPRNQERDDERDQQAETHQPRASAPVDCARAEAADEQR
jgi:hypothetical protein